MEPIETIIAEFEERFVEDAVSLEFTDDGKSFAQNSDTRLIADYIDGKTLTARIVTDWLRTTLQVRDEALVSKIEGMKRQALTTVYFDGTDVIDPDKSHLNREHYGYNQALLDVIRIITHKE